MEARTRIAVVGVDLGCTGDDALMEGLRLLAVGAVSKLHLLYVIDPKRVLDASHLLQNEERDLEKAPGQVQRRASSLSRLHDLPVKHDQWAAHARIGDPARTLLQMCVDYDADLLIVGTHGRKGLDRVLDGSVAEAVLRRAHCPVVVARRKDYTGLSRTPLPDQPYAPGEAPQTREVEGPHTHASTTMQSWHPSDNGPTGMRIV